MQNDAAIGERNIRSEKADEVLHSIMQRQLIESSTQDFAVTSELAGVYCDGCKYQLLLA
jgi:hypothetical protein